MKERTIYDLPDMAVSAYIKNLLKYIEFLANKHRATRNALFRDGKTYRSRFVAQENGYLNALFDITDSITAPERNRKLQSAIKALSQRLEG